MLHDGVEGLPHRGVVPRGPGAAGEGTFLPSLSPAKWGWLGKPSLCYDFWYQTPGVMQCCCCCHCVLGQLLPLPELVPRERLHVCGGSLKAPLGLIVLVVLGPWVYGMHSLQQDHRHLMGIKEKQKKRQETCLFLLFFNLFSYFFPFLTFFFPAKCQVVP